MNRAAAFLACALAVSACGTRTFDWEEDVTIHDGRVIALKRVVERHEGRASLPGSASMISQSIEVRLPGRTVVWKDDSEGQYLMPVIFEMVGEDPVIVLPVYGWPACLHYGFPPEGMVALRWKGGRWSPMPLAELPSGTHKNLLPSPENLAWPEYAGRKVDNALRHKIDAGLGSPGNPDDLAAMSRMYSRYGHACRSLRPPPDPLVDASRERNAAAERAAPDAPVRLVEESVEPLAVTKEEYWHMRGGTGLRNSCAGVVDRVEAVNRASGDENGYSITVIGYRVKLLDEEHKAGRLDFGYSNESVMIACDAGTIYVLRRVNATRLFLHRFREDGTLIDAHRIVLAEATRMGGGTSWGWLWNVRFREGGIYLMLADYDYRQQANLGGTLTHRQVYRVDLPPAR